MRTITLCLVSVLVTGCAHWHYATQDPVTISIPYVQGDATGKLTSLVTEEISKQPNVSIQDSSRYILKIERADQHTEKIGYRANPCAHKQIIPNESRQQMLVIVSIFDTATQTTVGKPAHILSSADYDHQYNVIRNDITKFSLGQLSDIDGAVDVVDDPLYRDIAKKIGEWLSLQASDIVENGALPKP